MMPKLILLTLLLALVACRPSPVGPSSSCEVPLSPAITLDHPKAARIQQLMDRFVARGIPGMSVLIADGDGVWYGSAGFADLESQLPMQPCHLNKLGSVTKLMLGTLAWQIIQEGDLTIDATMGETIPEIAAQIPGGEDITLQMLLDHSSGIYDIARDLDFNLAVINDFSRPWSPGEILDYIAGKPLNFPPGSEVRYSNTNTLLVAQMIEAATGRSHAELLQERIFDPLGMNRTVYFDYRKDFPTDGVAQGYLDLNNDGGTIQNLSALNPGNANGYTGVYSTVTDLYRFMRALLHEQTLTRPENLGFILENARETPDGSWRSSPGAIHNEFRDVLPDSIPAFGHAGGDLAYSANLNYLPHNQTIFAATFNYGTNLPSALGEELDRLRDRLILLMAE